jgi:DNA-binding winged helix-turn-helix (wHTH) protein/tetratricopeptide (TPR) repeat protein
MMGAGRAFDLGGWRVDPVAGTLARDGYEGRIEPRLMELLLLFAASPGRVISKDEIVASVWSGRAIGDDTLAATISRLRTALGEGNEAKFIETLPKRGYRLLIAPDGAAATPPPPQDDVAVLIAKGRAALLVPLPQSLAQARLYFETAIAADPQSAAAQAGLAEAMLAQHGAGQGAGFAASAKAAAQAASALDPDLAAAWTTLGAATLIADRDFAHADAALLKALALDSNAARAHRVRAFALAAIGRFPEAEREARRARELEPVSIGAHVDLVQVLLAARRLSSALAEAKKAVALSPASAEAWSALGWSQALLGAHRDAADALLESLRLSGTDTAVVAQLKAMFDAEGFEVFCAAGAALFAQQRVTYVARPMDLAILHAMAGDPDAAFASLDEALRRDDPVLLLLPHLPHLDRLRNDPRFAGVLMRARPVH